MSAILASRTTTENGRDIKLVDVCDLGVSSFSSTQSLSHIWGSLVHNHSPIVRVARSSDYSSIVYIFIKSVNIGDWPMVVEASFFDLLETLIPQSQCYQQSWRIIIKECNIKIEVGHKTNVDVDAHVEKALSWHDTTIRHSPLGCVS